MAPVLYLILGYCLSKLPLRRTLAVLILLGVLHSGLPSYADTFRYEKFTLDAGTTKCLQTVEPSSDALLITNNSHLCWTCFEYYYPQNPRILRSTPLECLNDVQEAPVFLFWDGGIDEENMNAIRARGYVCTQLFEGQFANGAYYHIYELQTRAHTGVTK